MTWLKRVTYGLVRIVFEKTSQLQQRKFPPMAYMEKRAVVSGGSVPTPNGSGDESFGLFGPVDPEPNPMSNCRVRCGSRLQLSMYYQLNTWYIGGSASYESGSDRIQI
jgi:hypothetical protein